MNTMTELRGCLPVFGGCDVGYVGEAGISSVHQIVVIPKHTQHVPLLVLKPSLIPNIRSNPEVDHQVVFD